MHGLIQWRPFHGTYSIGAFIGYLVIFNNSDLTEAVKITYYTFDDLQTILVKLFDLCKKKSDGVIATINDVEDIIGEDFFLGINNEQFFISNKKSINIKSDYDHLLTVFLECIVILTPFMLNPSLQFFELFEQLKNLSLQKLENKDFKCLNVSEVCHLYLRVHFDFILQWKKLERLLK